MGFRRSPDQVKAERAWSRFVERNAATIRDAGLPSAAIERPTAWDDLLLHGYVVGDPGAFALEQLNHAQYSAIVQLATNYFAAGYEFYSPTALRSSDQDALRARFGPHS